MISSAKGTNCINMLITTRSKNTIRSMIRALQLRITANFFVTVVLNTYDDISITTDSNRLRKSKSPTKTLLNIASTSFISCLFNGKRTIYKDLVSESLSRAGTR